MAHRGPHLQLLSQLGRVALLRTDLGQLLLAAGVWQALQEGLLHLKALGSPPGCLRSRLHAGQGRSVPCGVVCQAAGVSAALALLSETRFVYSCRASPVSSATCVCLCASLQASQTYAQSPVTTASQSTAGHSQTEGLCRWGSRTQPHLQLLHGAGVVRHVVTLASLHEGGQVGRRRHPGRVQAFVRAHPEVGAVQHPLGLHIAAPSHLPGLRRPVHHLAGSTAPVTA